MNRAIVAFFVCLASGLLSSPADITAGETEDAIVQAVTRYVLRETEVKDPSVVVEEVDGPFARVSVSSLSGKADKSTAFLKFDQGAWNVLSIGTAFFPEDLTSLGIPASLAD